MARHGRIGHRTLVVAAIAGLLVAIWGCDWSSDSRNKQKDRKDKKPARTLEVRSVAFTDINEATGDVYNASDLVPIGDGKFLIVDNNTNDALLELDLTADGKQAGPLVRRPLTGLADGAIDDVEDLAYAAEGGKQFIFASPSLSVKVGSKRKGKEQEVRPGGIVRIAIGANGTLTAEDMPGFRDWFVDNVPELKSAAKNDPDFGGLNVEGLEWDPARHALLFGIRTPVVGHRPIIVPVRVLQLDGPWDVSNLEVMPTIRLRVEGEKGDQGIRGLARGIDGIGFLLTVANATSNDNAPFALYEWDGSDQGEPVKLPVTFDEKIRPEGVTVGTVGGRPAIVFADDRGGFAVLWKSDLDAVTAENN